MKTLFIQTHELAKKLDPDMYTCPQLEAYFLQVHNMHWLAARNNSRIIMEMLFKEEKEFRKFDASGFIVLENIFDVQKYKDVVSYEQMMIKCVEIRQRLINSLLARPDRTLCVLIPE